MLHRSTLVTAVLFAAVAPVLADETPGVVIADDVSVRGVPFPNGEQRTFPTRLQRGESVTVIGEVGGDLQIARRAFVHGDYVVDGQVTNCNWLFVRASRNGDKVSVLRAGTQLQLTGNRNGDWLEIETIGFVPSSNVERVTLPSNPLDDAQPLEKIQPLPVLEIPVPEIEIEPLPLDIQLPTPQIDIPAPTLDDFEVADEAEADDELLGDVDLAEVEALLAELEANPEGMFDAHQERFTDRAEFDQAIVECRTLCEQLRALQDEHQLAGSYTLSRGNLFGKNPEISLQIRPTGLQNHYTVDRVRTHKGEVIENVGGVGRWDPSKGKLEVEWDRKNGVAQVLTNGADQGDDGAGVTAGDYRILAATGEIKGNFASPEEGWSGEKGWRDGSIKPLEGTYTLEPTWYAFGDKPETTLTVGPAREDGTRLVTRTVAERGIALEGVAEEIKDRKLRVSFPDHPRITYTIEENGKVKGTWRTDRRGSRRPGATHNGGDYRVERGWQEGATQAEIPGALKRTWSGLKGLFSR